jgi:hypothetical protein
MYIQRTFLLLWHDRPRGVTIDPVYDFPSDLTQVYNG